MNNRKSQPFIKFIKAGLQAGFMASVINLLWYFYGTKLLQIVGQTVLNPISVITSTMLAALLASIVLFLLWKRVNRPILVLRVIVFIVALISLYGAFAPELPDGTAVPDRFAVLAAPIHILSGITIGYFVPKAFRKNFGQMFRQTA